MVCKFLRFSWSRVRAAHFKLEVRVSEGFRADQPSDQALEAAQVVTFIVVFRQNRRLSFIDAS
jgi:hypothetical protein